MKKIVLIGGGVIGLIILFQVFIYVTSPKTSSTQTVQVPSAPVSVAQPSTITNPPVENVSPQVMDIDTQQTDKTEDKPIYEQPIKDKILLY